MYNVLMHMYEVYVNKTLLFITTGKLKNYVGMNINYLKIEGVDHKVNDGQPCNVYICRSI